MTNGIIGLIILCRNTDPYIKHLIFIKNFWEAMRSYKNEQINNDSYWKKQFLIKKMELIPQQLNNIEMGLWPWGFFSQMFTPKLWKSLKYDGLVMTYQRGHKIVANVHSVGGNSQRTRYVGMDQYGNKYYEDFDPLYRNARRWVEYNDFVNVRSPNGDMVPPKWQGWLVQQYDDVPLPDCDSFHDPFFEQGHQWGTSYNAFKTYLPGQNVSSQNHLEYIRIRKDRYAKEWDATTKRE